MDEMSELVKPGKCRRCDGRGWVTARRVHCGVPGTCFRCNGSGQVETDKATLAAAKAKRDEAERQTARRVAFDRAARAHSSRAGLGMDALRDYEPDRYQKALDSFEAGHPGLMDALEAYFRAHIRQLVHSADEAA